MMLWEFHFRSSQVNSEDESAQHAEKIAALEQQLSDVTAQVVRAKAATTAAEDGFVSQLAAAEAATARAVEQLEEQTQASRVCSPSAWCRILRMDNIGAAE